jgi:large subunit ribosomal protein L13
MRVTVIDASNLILGRMASIVAKRLLEGENIVIVNAEKCVITGSPHVVINMYKKRLRWRTYKNPELRGHKFQRRPDFFVKRAIRGMLPYRKPHGLNALRHLRVYVGIPEKFKNTSIETIDEAKLRTETSKFIYVSELTKHLGYVR